MAEIISQIGALAILLAGFVALLWRARRRGAADERRRRAEEDRASARKTRERMDDAKTDLGNDPAILRDWLRDRGRQ